MHVQCMAYVQCVSLLILIVHLKGLTRHVSHEEGGYIRSGCSQDEHQDDCSNSKLCVCVSTCNVCDCCAHVYSARCVYMSSIMRPLWVTHTHTHIKLLHFWLMLALGLWYVTSISWEMLSTRVL